MDNFIARANIDHLLELLRSNEATTDRAVVNKLLVEEEDKLSRNAEQLEFADNRAATYRRHFDHLCRWRDDFADGSSERTRADGVVTKFEITLRLVEGFCRRMRRELNGSGL